MSLRPRISVCTQTAGWSCRFPCVVAPPAALGAEIRGVDLARPSDDETFAAIERAYNDHAVIFFRDQHITPPQQVTFTRRFGEIEFNIFGERWSVQGSRVAA
jgi:alpha-ketoglutarate-dependent taurine dioxygenase